MKAWPLPISTKSNTPWPPVRCICTPRSRRVCVRSTTTGNIVWKRFDTTPGRLRLGNLLPLNAKAPFDLVNRLLRKKDVQTVIDTVYRYCGQKELVIFCDQIMGLGFREAFRAGISFGKDDMLIPDTKWTDRQRGADQVAGFRTAVSGRPDHPGREVQQGRRRLVQVQRQGRPRR